MCAIQLCAKNECGSLNTAPSNFFRSREPPPTISRCPPHLSRFADDQNAWRQQGRFLSYCSHGGGFGSWLKGLGTAVVISILTERALLLNSTCETLPTAVAKHVALYFRGDGFDWTDAPAQLERGGRSGREMIISPVCRAQVRPCGYNKTTVQGHSVADSTVR